MTPTTPDSSAAAVEVTKDARSAAVGYSDSVYATAPALLMAAAVFARAASPASAGGCAPGEKLATDEPTTARACVIRE